MLHFKFYSSCFRKDVSSLEIKFEFELLDLTLKKQKLAHFNNLYKMVFR